MEKEKEKGFAKKIGSFFKEVGELPTDIKEASEKIKEGKVQLDIPSVDLLRKELKEYVHQLLFAILFMACFIGSSLLLNAGFKPVINSISIRGIVGISLSFYFLYRTLNNN